MNGELLAIFTVLAEEHFFSARLPSRFTTKKFAYDEESKKYLAQGLIEAIVLSLITTFLIYYFSKKDIVLFISLIFIGILSLMYLNDMEIVKLY